MNELSIIMLCLEHDLLIRSYYLLSHIILIMLFFVFYIVLLSLSGCFSIHFRFIALRTFKLKKPLQLVYCNMYLFSVPLLNVYNVGIKYTCFKCAIEQGRPHCLTALTGRAHTLSLVLYKMF